MPVCERTQLRPSMFAQVADDIRAPEHAAKRKRQLAAWQRVIPDMFPTLQVRSSSLFTTMINGLISPQSLKAFVHPVELGFRV